MAKSIVLTASGVIKGGTGSLWNVNVTAASAGSFNIWDNPSAASGTKLYSGSGGTTQSYGMMSTGDGTHASSGLYFDLVSGTPTVVVVYD